MYAERVSAQSMAVSGTGNTATTAIMLPATFTPVAGGIYDILLNTQVPSDTDGTIINITNGTLAGNLYQRSSGNYARARALGWRKVLRVQFFDDPDHYNLLGVRG